MKIRYILTILTVGLLATACSEDRLNQSNENEVTVDQYFKNTDELKAATNGVYARMLGGNLWGRAAMYLFECRAEESRAGGGQLEVHNQRVLNGTYDYTESPIAEVWDGFYQMIHRANSVIENGPFVPNIAEADLDRCVAQAKFLRAYAYYHLVTLWGKVPVYTAVVNDPSDYRAVSEESEIQSLLETDLKEVIGLLPASYSGADRGRATKGAAELLLARTYMHFGKFADAKTVLEDIYSSGTYGLVDEYAENFREANEYNKESIFEIGFMGAGYTWNPTGDNTQSRSTIMYQDYNPTDWRNLIPSEKYLNEFETPQKGDPKEDPRLRKSVLFYGDHYGSTNQFVMGVDAVSGGDLPLFNGVVVAGWQKYIPYYNTTVAKIGYYQSDNNFRNMRYAEVLLKLAECEAQVSTTFDKARGYLNELRNRASVQMENYPTAKYPCNSKAEMYKAIAHEATIELGMEHVRVLDNARWRKNGIIPTILPEPVAYIAADASKALLPIPKNEVKANPKMNP